MPAHFVPSRSSGLLSRFLSNLFVVPVLCPKHIPTLHLPPHPSYLFHPHLCYLFLHPNPHLAPDHISRPHHSRPHLGPPGRRRPRSGDRGGEPVDIQAQLQQSRPRYPRVRRPCLIGGDMPRQGNGRSRYLLPAPQGHWYATAVVLYIVLHITQQSILNFTIAFL